MKHLLLTGLLVLMGLSGTSQFGPPTLLTPVFPDPYLCFPFDSDADGDDDLILASESSPILGIVEKIEGAVFHGLTNIPLLNFPADSLINQDLNGDGISEMLVYSKTTDAISCFTVQNNLPSNEVFLIDSLDAVISHKWIDADTSGLPDLVFCTLDKVFIARNLGNFALDTTEVLLDPTGNISSFDISDTDGDGDMDLTVGLPTDVRTYVNNGTGVYVNSVVVSTDNAAKAIQFVQVMGSPLPELFYHSTSFFWCLNNGNNSFGTPQSLGSGENQRVIPGNPDNDSDIDFLTLYYSSSGSGGIKKFTNNGTAFTSTNYSTDIIYGWVYLTDMNSDGNKDFLQSKESIGAAFVENYFGWYPVDGLWNITSGTTTKIPAYPLHVKRTQNSSSAFSDIQFADFDLDGDDDMLVTSLRKMYWYPNDGSGQFLEPPKFVHFPENMNVTDKPVLLDYNFDGDIDIFFPFDVSLVNDGSGNFAEGTLPLPPAPSWFQGDVNNDGHPEYYTLTSTQFRIYYSNSDGSYTSSSTNVSHNYGSLTVNDSYVMDFNGTGPPYDVAFSIYSPNPTVLLYEVNSLPNSFFAHFTCNCGGTHAPLIADYSLDGIGDYLCIGGLYWCEELGNNSNSHNPTISAEDQAYLASAYATKHVYTNIDGDTDVDILIYGPTSSTNHQVAWVELQIAENHLEVIVYNENLLLTDAYTAHDLDMDGDEEILCSIQDGSVCIRENYFNSSFQYHVAIKAFHDENDNGAYDEGEASVEEIPFLFSPDSSIYFSSDQEFLVVPRAPGTYDLAISLNEFSEWTYDGELTQQVVLDDLNPTDTLYFNLQNTGSASIDAYATTYRENCPDSIVYQLHVRNNTNTIGDYHLTMKLDSLLAYEFADILPDSIIDNVIHWNVAGLLPAQEVFISLRCSLQEVNTETITHSTFEIQDAFSEILYSQVVVKPTECDTATLTKKQINGLFSPGYVAAGSEVIYTVEYSAGPQDSLSNLIFVDQLPDGLILNSFELLEKSHPAEVTLGNDGDLLISINEILFENSDSTFRMTYRFDVEEEIEAGTELYNTILLITGEDEFLSGTALNTIFDCETLAQPITSTEIVCSGGSIEAYDTWNIMEEYSWIQNNTIQLTDTLLYVPSEIDSLGTWLVSTNPFCTDTALVSIIVNPPIEVEISYTISDSIIVAPSLGSYQWYFEGSPLEGETDSLLYAQEEGIYSLAGTNEDGCSVVSQELTVVLTCSEADFDCDGIVNLNDLLILLQNFGCTENCTGGDVNGDGFVNVIDLILLITFSW